MASHQFQVRRQLAARCHVFLHIALGSAALVCGLATGHWSDPLRFASFVVAATLGSTLKVKLPGQSGTASVSSLFVLISLVNLSVSETLVVGALSVIVQCLWRTQRRPKFVQIWFSVSVLAIAVCVSSYIFTFTRNHFPELVALAILPFTYFCTNIFPVAAVIGLTEGKPILRIWGTFRWTLAYYTIGASMAWVIGTLPHGIQWEFPIICLPLVYLVHRSNRTHLTQMERERSHMQAMNDLHLRTIEALALAIDAKDHTTHDHLQRVQLYAVEIGKDLGLSELELEALTAAAVLHDIGKLAVPESIISKPGKLTRSEFEKMKIHPVVGAEILERVAFPYPVVPIVRSHHEKWDGSGYPHGLKGEEIPIGARILSAVDCLDALASDRQYRKALPLDEAMARVVSEAGTAFDPRVVHALRARYQELEARAKATKSAPQPMLSVDIKITRGEAPAAGFESEAPAAPVCAFESGCGGACQTAPERRIGADYARDGPLCAAVGRGSGNCRDAHPAADRLRRDRLFRLRRKSGGSEVCRGPRPRTPGGLGRPAWRRSSRLGGRCGKADLERQSNRRTGVYESGRLPRAGLGDGAAARQFGKNRGCSRTISPEAGCLCR